MKIDPQRKPADDNRENPTATDLGPKEQVEKNQQDFAFDRISDEKCEFSICARLHRQIHGAGEAIRGLLILQ
jgi:hypothetical protein